MAETMLNIQSLSFSYSEHAPLFIDFDFELASAEVCSILGESGSGKSTLLKLIYGIYNWDSGNIFFANKEIFGPKGNLIPGEEGMKWVSQDFDLMPYTTVAENVGIYFSNIRLKQKREKVMELLEVVGLTSYADSKVAELSGGQKQRVALAKALAEQPKLLLLDEAFNQIDAHLKNKLQRRLFQYIRENKITVLMVTHQIQDALAFADRVVVLDHGVIIENQASKELYLRPQQQKTAKLLGDMNILNGKLLGLEDIDYFIHPFQLKISDTGLECTVLHSYFRGSHYLIEADHLGKRLYCTHPHELDANTKILLQYHKEEKD